MSQAMIMSTLEAQAMATNGLLSAATMALPQAAQHQHPPTTPIGVSD